MRFTKEQITKAIDMLLSTKGKAWLEKLRVSQRDMGGALLGAIELYEENEHDNNDCIRELRYNCGATEIQVSGCTRQELLALILYSVMFSTPLIVATAVANQKEEIAIFKKLGFKQGPWVTRDSNGSVMCFLTLSLEGGLKKEDFNYHNFKLFVATLLDEDYVEGVS